MTKQTKRVQRADFDSPGGWGNFTIARKVRVYCGKNALARAPISAATAPLPPQTGLNGSHAGADSIKPIWGGRGAAGKKLFWQPLCCSKRLFAAYASQGFRLNPFSEFSERPLRASGWAQAARWAFGYVQVRQGKYQVMWPGAAQARASGP